MICCYAGKVQQNFLKKLYFVFTKESNKIKINIIGPWKICLNLIIPFFL